MRAPTQPTYDRSQSLFHRTPRRRLVKGPLSNDMTIGCYELKCMRENHELHEPKILVSSKHRWLLYEVAEWGNPSTAVLSWLIFDEIQTNMQLNLHSQSVNKLILFYNN